VSRMNYLFGTGTARGGTGILVQTLSAHSKIEYSLDPALGIYRSFRNELMKKKLASAKFAKFDLASPLSDYYYSDFQNEILNVIFEGNLDLEVDPHEREGLAESMKPRAGIDNPDIIDFMTDGLKGSSYAELIGDMVKLIAKIRGSDETRYSGFHENWTIEMFPALARKFHHAKFIIVLRDPRAALASEMAVSPELRSSLLSYIRGIRKLFNLAMYYLGEEIFRGRLAVVTYEELLRNPESLSKKLCEFLGVGYESDMINPDFHVIPGTNVLRNGVSSFEKKATGYNPERIDRWEKNLAPGVLELTEMALDPDMRFFNYMPTVDRQVPLDFSRAFETLSLDNNKKFKWRTDSDQTELEFGLELSRRCMVNAFAECESENLVKRCFLNRSIYLSIRGRPEYEEGCLAKGGVWFA
jgi:hypothetical protein